MITPDGVRELALALPEAEEKEHWGRPSFRVRNKIFATLWENERRAVVKVPKEIQSALVASAPQTFFHPGNFQGVVGIELAHVEPDELKRLMIESWRLMAPRRLVQAYDLANQD